MRTVTFVPPTDNKKIIFFDFEWAFMKARMKHEDVRPYHVGWKILHKPAQSQYINVHGTRFSESDLATLWHKQFLHDTCVFVSWSTNDVDKNILTRIYTDKYGEIPTHWSFFNPFWSAQAIWRPKPRGMSVNAAASITHVLDGYFPSLRLDYISPILFPGYNLEFHRPDDDCKALELIYLLLNAVWERKDVKEVMNGLGGSIVGKSVENPKPRRRVEYSNDEEEPSPTTPRRVAYSSEEYDDDDEAASSSWNVENPNRITKTHLKVGDLGSNNTVDSEAEACERPIRVRRRVVVENGAEEMDDCANPPARKKRKTVAKVRNCFCLLRTLIVIVLGNFASVFSCPVSRP
ncbi:uncharacterized protein SPPG_01795 [Spizellomyces punctatus DAOM BR117]|uniref:Uncharacterized protein n=1 Tax=Spizellomyces punctatus (strain DAOM BR117) TaxID=645134 RepID=A0A0L0HNQ2_SPIPD|nr:uncharacterized protein SPPG_01795 [Spizellomyces punctatus DAOM BR117]KND02712.1 hypothetical protein SPPG_01795 [Spizellomyces punctatus DAOM BR117]|eukprot:XP_016610751.1 hypothetical protein SPPG_01795 [Spizellomyces punctatus DAOM BR117]